MTTLCSHEERKKEYGRGEGWGEERKKEKKERKERGEFADETYRVACRSC